MTTNISCHILLAEDDEGIQWFIVRLLEEEGHTVEVAGNGKEAVVLLEKQRFDLVLMDIQMPVMDGFETTRTIRDPDSRVLDHGIPIIAFTALECRERCFKAGMDAYISKPIGVEEFLAALNSFATGREAFAERKIHRGKKVPGGGW